MAEKRFTYMIDRVFDLWAVYDNKEKVICLVRNTDAKDLCDLLNELHEENQELHKTIEELDNCQKGQSHRINDLYLENKQLKDLITHLGYTIKYDGYRHISLELKKND